MNTQSSSFLGHRGANKARVGCQTCPALCARTLPHTSSDGDSGQLVSDGDGFRHSRLTGQQAEDATLEKKLQGRAIGNIQDATYRPRAKMGSAVAARNAPHIHQ